MKAWISQNLQVLKRFFLKKNATFDNHKWTDTRQK